MIDSALVYLGLMLIMMLFAWIGGKSKNYPYLWAAISSLAFGIVMGVRMHVGVDFDMYYNVYEGNKAGWFGGFGYNRWEPGFQLIYFLCSSQFLHYSIPFGIIAFLQIFLVFLGTRKLKEIWVFLPLTLFLCSTYISYNNIMRHMVAFSVFVFSIQYLADRKYWKYLLCIIIAACFHKSALTLIVLPLIYAWIPQIFTKIWPQLLLLAISLILMNINLVQQVFESISIVMSVLRYDGYMQTHYAEFDEKTGFGIRMVFIVASMLIIIFFSKKIKAYYESRTVNIMYDLYIIGMYIRFAFLKMFLIQRYNWFFMGFEFIVGAFALNYFAKKKEWIWLAVWILMYLAVFFARLNIKDDGEVLYHAFFEY